MDENPRIAVLVVHGIGYQQPFETLDKAASANIEDLDPEAGDAPIVRSFEDDARLTCVLSNSFGFGGTNASLAFRRYDD